MVLITLYLLHHPSTSQSMRSINSMNSMGIGNSLLFLLTLLALLPPTSQWSQTFCSVVCSKMNCNNGNITPNACTACNTFWMPSGTTCTPNNTNAYYLFDQTNDLGGTLVVAPTATASAQCTGGGAGVTYNLYGWMNSASTVTVSSATGIKKSFYQMVVYFGIVTTDVGGGGGGWRTSGVYWNSNTFFTLAFSGGDGFAQSNSYKMSGSTKIASGNNCYSNSRSEQWNKVIQSYNYGTPNVSLTFNINNNETNATALWGIKEFIIIYRGCNPLCQTCFGPLVTQCYSCIYDPTTNSSWLSGTTCNQTCLSQYGYSTNTSFCILCDPHCTQCYDSSTNCLACTTFGKYIAYLYASNATCMNPCPEGYFANKTAQTCDICNSNCTGCLYNPNYCTACISGMYWYQFTCYSPCPDGTFLNANLLNCTKCDLYCSICIGPSTLCTVCQTVAPYTAYLYNTTNATGSCMRTCPQGYYAQTANSTNLCLACDPSCYYCTNSPSPCQQCVAGYYLYNSACYNTCPTGLFASNATGSGQCLDCNVVCVDLTLSMQFSNALNNQIYIDLIFSQSLNFSTFDYKNFQTITITSGNMHYTLDMFNLTYQIKSQSSYRIILKPAGYIFLYNATFTVTTEAQPNATEYSTLGMPFKTSNYLKSASLNWFLIQGPPFSSLEENIMTSFATLSQKTNDFLDLPYLQEIKKSGVFNLLFSGAQITSCSVLSNQIQSQNLYEGVRFWAIFVFFDVPPYQQISNQTKNFIGPSVESQIRNALEVYGGQVGQGQVEGQVEGRGRVLFSTDVMYWRFQRTGQTSFFIYDCYVPVAMLVVCWVSLFIVHKVKKTRWYSKHAGKVYSAVHKVHQISLMYVTMAAIVEFTYFQTTSVQRFISAGVCVLFNLYFVVYYLYIYYDMLKYPLAEIGNAYYDYYVYRYGSFLKNIRFQEYNIHQNWSPKHWLRPYNFHFLSYYKKFLMMITLPLFYSTQYAQMGILFSLQILELARICVVWPFVSNKRNYLRLSLEVALGLFFLTNLIQISLLDQIQSGNINDMGPTISLFYGFGWAGFLLVFYFNIAHVAICVHDFIRGLRVSTRAKMDQARKQYYYSKIKEYQKDNQGASRQLVNKWVKLGNLNNQYFGELPEINIRIEEYCMRMVLGNFEVSVKKITQLRMMTRRNHKKKNNTVTTKKIEKKGILQQHKYPKLYELLHGYYSTLAQNHIETVILKTFLNVFQPDYQEGEDIPFYRGKMFQKVELISFDNQSEEREVAQLIEGFPIPQHLFEDF